MVQRHLRYIGKEADGKTILSSSISHLAVDQVKVYGPLLVLNHLANEVGLPSTLGEFASEILSLVYAHCIDYRSVNQMKRWFERTDLNLLLNLEGVTEARFLRGAFPIFCKLFNDTKNFFKFFVFNSFLVLSFVFFYNFIVSPVIFRASDLEYVISVFDIPPSP